MPNFKNTRHSTPIIMITTMLLACAASSQTLAAASSVEGALDKDAIRAVVRERIVDVRTCYNAELVEDATVAGRSEASFVVQPDGSVSQIAITDSTMPARFDACLSAAIQTWQFPSVAGKTSVVYPFEMSPG